MRRRGRSCSETAAGGRVEGSEEATATERGRRNGLRLNYVRGRSFGEH